MTLRDSSVVSNSALHGAAGGTGGTAGDAGNSQGGGIFIAGGTALISNSTVATNIAGGAAGVSRGGGVFNAGTLDLRNSTLADNTSADEGGGVRNEGTLTLVSTLIGRNASTGTSADDLSDPGGTTTASFSLIQTTLGHSIADGASNNIVGHIPLLSLALAPATNGNGTFVLRLLPHSPAIDKGANPDSLAFDQEGASRTQGKQTDIGAVETSVALMVVSNGKGAVRVLDANTGTVYQSFLPFDTRVSGYRALVSVALGDVNGDGFADIIVASREPGTVASRSMTGTRRSYRASISTTRVPGWSTDTPSSGRSTGHLIPARSSSSSPHSPNTGAG